MTDLDRPDDVDQYDVRNAEETSRAGEFRYAPSAGATPLDEERDAGDPVPEFPLHLCPWCDFNLKGVTSRRCPQCSKAFTLEDALRRASDRSKEAQRDFGVIRGRRITFVVGLTLLAIGYFGPILITPTAVRVWVSSTLTGTMLVTVFMYKVFFQRTWSHAALVAGILAMGIGGLVLLIGIRAGVPPVAP